MRSVPRGVVSSAAVYVSKHRPRQDPRRVRVVARHVHAVRSPIVAGVIDAVGEGASGGVGAGQGVMFVLYALGAAALNLSALFRERGGPLDVVAIALKVAVQVVDVCGDHLALGIVPGARAD